MDRKIIMGVAAVAGIGLLLYMRKSGDQATIAGAVSGLNNAGGFENWASQPIVINATTKPLPVADTVAAAPAPAPAPAPVQQDFSGFVIGGAVPGVTQVATTGQMTAAEHAEYQRRLGLGW